MGEPWPQAAQSVQPAAASEPVLVLGASGLVGSHLLALDRRQHLLLAPTRAPMPPPALAGLAHWQCGERFDLERGAGPWPDAGTVLSAGPLSALAGWLQRQPRPALRRLVALSSTSVTVKAGSPDPGERDTAQTLASAEAAVVRWCRDAGVAWTLLRPTLIWGDGRDRNLSRLAALARRWRLLLLPGHATGLRQPIRADDVAAAMWAACAQDGSIGRCLELPGGESLAYDQMCRRIAEAVAPPGRVLRLRGLPLAAAVRAAAGLHLIDGASAAAVARMGQDLVFDPAPARTLLGIEPAGFHPDAGDFPPA